MSYELLHSIKDYDVSDNYVDNALLFHSGHILPIEKLAEPKEVTEKTNSYPVPDTMQDFFVPFEHQGKAIFDKLVPNDGKLIVAHKMGLGKTVTGIYGVETLRMQGKATNTIVVVPAGLRENFAKEGLEKFLKNADYQIVASSGETGRANYVAPSKLDPNKQYTIVSYSMFRRYPEAFMQATGADTIIMDEFHKARNEGSGVFKAAIRARGFAKNFIGLTASPVNNEPSEIASLLTVAEGERMITPKQFQAMHTEVVGYDKGLKGGKKPVRGIKEKGRLAANLDPRVDYGDSTMLEGGKTLPRKDTQYVDVEMSPKQWKLYRLAMNELGPFQKYVTEGRSDVTMRAADSLFARTSKARQISNSLHTGTTLTPEAASDATPKVKRMLDDAQQHLSDKPDNKIVLYSNLINGGVDVISAGLKKRGVDHAIFVGKGTEIGENKVTSKVRDAGIQEFKDGKKRVLVLSGAGAEGLSLNNATGFYSLDGHFNPERVLQAEARVRRLGGQSHRPEEERSVDVRRYRSVAPNTTGRKFRRYLKKGGSEKTIDQWTYGVAERKHRSNQEFQTVLKKPHKYTRKWRDTNTGKWRYEYDSDASRSSLFGRIKAKARGTDSTPEPPAKL